MTEKSNELVARALEKQTETQKMMEAFAQSQQEKNQTVEVIKQLFDHDKLKKIAQLNSDERNILIAIYTIAELEDVPMYKQIADMYVEMSLSLDRKSRKEVIEAIKGSFQPQQNGIGDRMASVFRR